MQSPAKSKTQNTTSGDPELVEFIRAEIRARGPVTFAWFMEQALYHPTRGYYSSGRAAIGRDGDYFTSVSVGPLFGRMLAAQFAEMWEQLGCPNDFTIVEQGANNGQFALDVLRAAEKANPEFRAALQYVIVEPLAILREQQEALLGESVRWRVSLEELEPFCGVHFSNELIDSMPVHLVRSRNGEWTERYVEIVDDQFGFFDGSISSAAIRDQLVSTSIDLLGDRETEVNLAALCWLEQLSRKSQGGYILAADYGHTVEQRAERGGGTLTCRSQHRQLASPFEQIGSADITTHVDWHSIMVQARRNGFQVCGLVDQQRFLGGLLSARMQQPMGLADGTSRRALQTLLHPEFLGARFQFLALARPHCAYLSGFTYSRSQP